MQAEFVRQNNELSDVVSLWFKPPSGFSFVAGDYTELSIGSHGVADRRWLSIASAPNEPDLQFTLKLGKPLSKFKQALMKLKQGDTVLLSPPMGNFNLPNRPDKLLFIAGGVGITPFRSLLLQEQAKPIGHDIQLFYTAKPKQHLFIKELNKTKAKINYFDGSKPVTLESIKESSVDLTDRIIYLAGPQPLMEALYDQLVKESHPRWRLRLCYFDNYLAI